MEFITEFFHKKGVPKVGFEDIQWAILHPNDFYLINTLPVKDQNCLIHSTLAYDVEEKWVNELLSTYDQKQCKIILYGRNAQDETVEKKYRQMTTLGIENVFIYPGGMFEWMLLQDIYGPDLFPTTCRNLDILYYKERPVWSK
jgi:hypothetical protein